MFSLNPRIGSPEIVLDRHISVKAAAEFSGYNVQYLRRLLKAGRLEGIKIGQVWLIKLASLEAYVRNGHMVGDRRHCPKTVFCEQDTPGDFNVVLPQLSLSNDRLSHTISYLDGHQQGKPMLKRVAERETPGIVGSVAGRCARSSQERRPVDCPESAATNLAGSAHIPL